MAWSSPNDHPGLYVEREHAIGSTMNRQGSLYRGAIATRTTTTAPPISTSYTDRAVAAERALRRAVQYLQASRRANNGSPRAFPRLPAPSHARLEASVNEEALDISRLDHRHGFTTSGNEKEKEKTVLYLAYGSNLSTETFRGRRGINPISQLNVVVPALRLTFDLPGIPYIEPCFGNTALRDPSLAATRSTPGNDFKGEDYHRDRWHKGLVGCVYEVTMSDFIHIIATEGGGASYQDILVDCYALPEDSDIVPEFPDSAPFKAHTLFAPIESDPPPVPPPPPPPSKSSPTSTDLEIGRTTTPRFSRPNPSYAQPSPRYLNLITTGARELSLPAEYQTYLHSIRTYHITTTRQSIGQKFFVGFWAPFLFFMFALERQFQDGEGRSPGWLVVLTGALFRGMWGSYDGMAKGVFGDGERTIGTEEEGRLLEVEFRDRGYAEEVV